MNEGVIASADYKVSANGRKYPAKRIHMGTKEQQVSEASYRGNIGVMELAKFHSTAKPADKEKFTELMKKKASAKTDEEQRQMASQIWDHVQKVTGTKLHQMESTMIPFKTMLESKEDFILQSLADKDINASIKDGKVVVHDHTQHAKAKSMVKRMGMPHEVVKGMKEDLDESDEYHNSKYMWKIEGGSGKGKFFGHKDTSVDDHLSAMQYHAKEAQKANNEKRYPDGRHHAMKYHKHKDQIEALGSKGSYMKDSVDVEYASTTVQEAMPTHEFNKLVRGYLAHKKAAKIGGFKPMSMDQYKRTSVKALSVKEDVLEESYSVGDVIHIHYHSIAGKDYHGTTNIDRATADYVHARHPETNEIIKFRAKTKTQVGAVAGSRAGAYVFSTSKNEETIDELSKETLDSYSKKAEGHAKPGRDWQRLSGLLRAQMKKKEKTEVKEDKTDTVTMDVPLLTRVLEMAREDIKSDEELHVVVTKLIEMSKNGTLSMENYKKLTEDKNMVVPTLKPRDPNHKILAAKKNAGGAHRDKKKEMKRGNDKHKSRMYEETQSDSE